MEFSELTPAGSGWPLPTGNEAVGCAYALGAIAHVLAGGGQFQDALEQLIAGLDLEAAGLVPDGDPEAIIAHRPDLVDPTALAANGQDLVVAAQRIGPVFSRGTGAGWAALPVLTHGRGYGFLWATREQGAFSPAQSAALSAAAAQFGMALALRQAERRAQRHPTWDQSSAGTAWATQHVRRPVPALPGLVEPLSERELSVLRAMATGRRNKAIADELHISENTVKFHIQNIYQKLGVDNRTAASGAAMAYGLLD